MQSNAGITQAGGVCSRADDLTGRGNPWTATLGNRPGTSLRVAGVPTLRFHSAGSEFMSSGLTLVAPGTRPVLFYSVYRIITWSNNPVNDIIFSGNSAAFVVDMNTVSPDVWLHNGAGFQGPNVGAPVGSWARQTAYFSNSPNDYLKQGASLTPLLSSGNNAEVSGFQIAAFSGTRCSDIELFCRLVIYPGPDIAAELAAADVAVTRLFQGIVAV